jgi:hypothetical protein
MTELLKRRATNSGEERNGSSRHLAAIFLAIVGGNIQHCWQYSIAPSLRQEDRLNRVGILSKAFDLDRSSSLT